MFLAAALFALGVPRPARAACTQITLSAPSVNFTYDPTAAGAVQIPLQLFFDCKAPTVDVSSGQRVMTSSTDSLPYKICVDAACATSWPEGTAAVSVLKDLGSGKSWSSTMYFQIDPGQDVSVGTYTTTITVTLLP
jgi:spore coat protein U-like protein